MNWPIRTRDYLFAQDLKLQESLQIFYHAILPLSHMFSTTNLYWHRRESFSTRHHPIFVLINRELLLILGKKEEKCECDWPSLANGMVGWSLYVVWPFYTCPATLKLEIGQGYKDVKKWRYELWSVVQVFYLWCKFSLKLRCESRFFEYEANQLIIMLDSKAEVGKGWTNILYCRRPIYWSTRKSLM